MMSKIVDAMLNSPGKKVTAQFFLPGDKVLWKGIKLTVYKVYEDGSITAHSPTMQLTVSGPEHLEKFSGV
jgi:hypothetical protein